MTPSPGPAPVQTTRCAAILLAASRSTGMSLPIKVAKETAAQKSVRESITFRIAPALAAGSIAPAYGLARSRHGPALTAIRDSEPAAESAGVDDIRTRYMVYVAAAFVAGPTGALIFFARVRISPEAAFNVVDRTTCVIFIVVIGGVGRIEGPIVGTAVFFTLRGFPSDPGSTCPVILGALAVVVMLKAPAGLWGLVLERFGFELFPVRRRLVPARSPPRDT